jgi:hypothetical protein
MNTRHLLACTALALVPCLTPTLALAHGEGIECKVPAKEWQPKEALAGKLEKDGWTIRKLKVDNGCYEVYGFDAKGKKREAYFDPKTLDMVGDMMQK